MTACFFMISTFTLRNTMPPPVMIIVGSSVRTRRSASVSASRNCFSPCSAKISGIDIPKFAATISSVSCKAKPVLLCRHRPTDDFPAPIIPTRTIDRLRPFTIQYLINIWLGHTWFRSLLSEAKHLWMRSSVGKGKPEIPRLCSEQQDELAFHGKSLQFAHA